MTAPSSQSIPRLVTMAAVAGTYKLACGLAPFLFYTQQFAAHAAQCLVLFGGAFLCTAPGQRFLAFRPADWPVLATHGFISPQQHQASFRALAQWVSGSSSQCASSFVVSIAKCISLSLQTAEATIADKAQAAPALVRRPGCDMLFFCPCCRATFAQSRMMHAVLTNTDYTLLPRVSAHTV
jgi:hypothetical protein